MIEDYPRTLMDLERRFSTEQACREYLFGLRWPTGFACPRCGGVSAWTMKRGLWLCRGCRARSSWDTIQQLRIPDKYRLADR